MEHVLCPIHVSVSLTLLKVTEKKGAKAPKLLGYAYISELVFLKNRQSTTEKI
jgi:hypothetical protein